MRDYVDRLRAEEPNNRKIRERVMGNNFSNNETTAPLLAPRWTCAGYEGRLKDAIIEACNDYQPDNQHQQLDQPDNQHQQLDQPDNQHQQLDQLYSHDDLMELTERERAYNDGYDGEEEEEEEEEEDEDEENEEDEEDEETVLLTSNDRFFDQNSDDEDLEMDD